jgi:hypothetical protein
MGGMAVGMSGAIIVKGYAEKFVFINQLKIRKNKYPDPRIARESLSIAYDIIHEMEYLISSNNANNFGKIKNVLEQHSLKMHSNLQKRHSFLRGLFSKTKLPGDFSKFIQAASHKLNEFEKDQFNN